MIQVASRMSLLSEHFFAELGARIARIQGEGNDVIRLDIGSPDLPPPAEVIGELSRSAQNPTHHGYQSHRATPALRMAWAQMYHALYGIELDADQQVVPLIGTKEGIFNLMSAIIDPGDIVLIPDPGYITYTRGARFAGGSPYYFPLIPEYDYLPNLERIPEEVLRRAKVLWLNYPNNPTGAVATSAFFEQAIELARRYGLLVCHDAAYVQITYDNYRSPSILQAPGAIDLAVEFNTLSKSHNMAGWRVGAALGNPAALKGLYTLKTNLDSGHFRPILDAAVQAITGDQSWLVERNRIYQDRRDIMVVGLEKLGMRPKKPSASLYIWCSVPQGWSSEAFCFAALDHAAVSLTPGTVFGQTGEGFVRIAITEPVDRIELALERLRDWFAGEHLI